jgi:predicted RNA methylase
LGAGTGRVAVPLAQAGRKVVALDLDIARLKRMPQMSGLYPV